MKDRKAVLAAKILEVIEKAKAKSASLRITFSHEDAWKSIDISGDEIVHIDSSEITEKYGALLLMNKLVAPSDLKKATQNDSKPWQVDDALIAELKLDANQVRKVFSLQLSRMIHTLLEWPALSFKISTRDSGNPPAHKKPLPLSELKLHLLRLAPPEDEIREIRQNKDKLFTISPGKMSTLRHLPLNAKEGTVLSRIKGRLSPDSIAQEGQLPPEQVFELVAVFHHLGLIDEEGRQRAAAPSPSPAPPPVETPVSENDLNAILQEFREYSEELQTKDYYELFAMSRDDFSASRLKTNYYALAKKYHPDKYRKYGSEEINRILEDLLNIFNTAYEVLKDPQRKHNYDTELGTSDLKPTVAAAAAKGGPRPQDMEQIAQDNFQQGRNLIQLQKYAEAISFLRRSVQIKPENAEYNAYLAYAMSKVPQFRKEAEKHFLKAIEINPMNVNTYLHLGRLYKDAHLNNKALAVFQEALRWDPENKVALQEIEEISGVRKSKGGLFGGLFKK
jgi:curved DNA-binding protein CbpA